MATRAVLQTFEKYQKERVAFVTSVAEMAKNPQVGSVGCTITPFGASCGMDVDGLVVGGRGRHRPRETAKRP